MLSNKYVLVSIIFCAVYANAAQLPPDQRLKAERECVNEVQIDYNIVLEAARSIKVPKNPDYKRFIHCYWTKQGLQGSDGKIGFDVLASVLQDGQGGYTEPQARAILEPCKQIIALPEELPVLVLECIFLNLPDLK